MVDKPDQNVPKSVEPIRWLTDLIRLEIGLWEQIDTRLKQEHNLPLVYFEPLYFIAQESEKSLRVGDLARRLQVTVGGTSKLVDRIERAGFIRREVDPTNRRASLLFLTEAGENILEAASQTYAAEMTQLLNAVLSPAEQHQMHVQVLRLLKLTFDQKASATI